MRNGWYIDYFNQGEKNIGRWTQFCDPLKKNGMISWRAFLEKINGIQDMYHNNSNNLGATLVKLSEKSSIFITDLLMFGNNSLRGRSKKSFRY